MKVADLMLEVSALRLSEVAAGVAIVPPVEYGFVPVVDEHNRYLGVIERPWLQLLVQEQVAFAAIKDYCLDGSVPCVSAMQSLAQLPDCMQQAVVTGKNGEIVGIVTATILNDRLRKQLLEFKDWFFTAINATQSGILAIDCQGCIIIANKVVEKILGYQGGLAGHQITELIPNTFLPTILKTHQPVLGQRITLGDTPVMADYAPIISCDVVIGAICVFKDESVLEQVTGELNYVKQLTNELEAIINSSYDGMFVTDGDGTVLRVNQAYERISGLEATELLGKTMQQLVDEGYYDQSATLLIMERGERITITQTVKGDISLLVTGNPIFADDGRLFRVVTNVRDVTELTKLQEQLNRTKEQTLKYKTELSHLRSLQITSDEIIFRSSVMAKAIATAAKVADVDSTVLITGDSGTGKELIAKLIHKHGKGVSKPFIKINCAALPEQLLESELFGYESGAFTGARKEGKPGLFELAHNGTLFLDEVGDMPLVLQVKLLRAIQEKEIMRVGGTKLIQVNVRIIAATHHNLDELVETRKFRRDLYYRLMVVPIQLAPLRERKEDIPLLVVHFMDKFNRQFGFNKIICSKVVDRLINYSWPGNVRELENLIERMLVMATGDELTLDHLPEYLNRRVFIPKRGSKLKAAVEQTEAFLLTEAYKELGSWSKAAEVLEVDRATVYRKAKQYGLLKT